MARQRKAEKDKKLAGGCSAHRPQWRSAVAQLCFMRIVLLHSLVLEHPRSTQHPPLLLLLNRLRITSQPRHHSLPLPTGGKSQLDVNTKALTIGGCTREPCLCQRLQNCAPCCLSPGR